MDLINKLEALDEDDLEAWKANGVTELLRQIIDQIFAVQKQLAMEAYWNGSPMPEADQKALRRSMMVFEDFFESSIDDLKIAMEMFDEHKRNPAAGIQRAREATGRPH